MEQDGAALCEFFAWFEANLGQEVITELTVDEQLSAARARRPNFVSLSFSTIAAFNGNGAMPHYRATEQSHAVIEGDGLLLIDSGGQYLVVPPISPEWCQSVTPATHRSWTAPGTQGHDRPVACHFPARNTVAVARRHCPGANLG